MTDEDAQQQFTREREKAIRDIEKATRQMGFWNGCTTTILTIAGLIMLAGVVLVVVFLAWWYL